MASTMLAAGRPLQAAATPLVYNYVSDVMDFKHKLPVLPVAAGWGRPPPPLAR